MRNVVESYLEEQHSYFYVSLESGSGTCPGFFSFLFIFGQCSETSFEKKSAPPERMLTQATLRYLLKEHACLTIYERFSTLLANFHVINSILIKFRKKFHLARLIDPAHLLDT